MGYGLDRGVWWWEKEESRMAPDFWLLATGGMVVLLTNMHGWRSNRDSWVRGRKSSQSREGTDH